jgi:hypothetical protein
MVMSVMVSVVTISGRGVPIFSWRMMPRRIWRIKIRLEIRRRILRW